MEGSPDKSALSPRHSPVASQKKPHGEQSRRKLRVDARAFASVGWPAHARTVLPLADKNLLLALTDKPNTVQLDVPFDDDPETSRELHAQA
jgi:hypothetical protein